MFVDTSIWYAAADMGDAGNARAKEILGSGEVLVSSDHVLVETWVLLRHRLHRTAADRFWDGLRRGVADVEPVTRADLEAAWAIGQSFQDQDFSIVDPVMERLGLHRAAAFDDDFAVYRYGTGRQWAFDVIR